MSWLKQEDQPWRPTIPKLGLGKSVGLRQSGMDADGNFEGEGGKVPKLELPLHGDGAPKTSDGSEVRPSWEFDMAEIALGHRIGAGAFGEVYEASWRRSRIAVKRLLCQRLTESARREFMNEMQLMSNLRHPHIG